MVLLFLFKISHFQCLTAGLPILQGHHVSTEAHTDRTSGICLCFFKLDNHLFAEDKARGQKSLLVIAFVHLSKCNLCEILCSSAQEEDVTAQDSRRQRNKDTRRLNRRRGGEGTEQVSILVLPLIPTSVALHILSGSRCKILHSEPLITGTN